MIFTSVIVAGVSLIVGVVMGLAAGRHEERKRWENWIGRPRMDGLGNGVRRETVDPQFTSRDDRLEQAVEAIAVEVERVAEGQRFVTKLLAERSQPLSDRLPQPKQSITPH